MVRDDGGCTLMRIAIAYNFNDSDWFGGRNYFASLFSALDAISRPGLKMVLVMGHKTQSSLPEHFPSVEVLRTSMMDRMHPAWLARQVTLRKFQNDYLLAWYLSRHGIDLLSHSGYLGPRSSIRTLPWLYDFQFMHLPEYWTEQQIRWSEQRYNDACRHGHGLIVSSEDARHDLDNFAPWCDKPKYVMQFVSNPVDFDGLPTQEDIHSRYQLPARYFHLPNQFWSNKNHRCAIDALVVLKRAGVDATIACSGKTFDGRMPQYFDELMDYCRTQGVQDRFRVLGVVPHKDLQGLMAHATGVINPSRDGAPPWKKRKPWASACCCLTSPCTRNRRPARAISSTRMIRRRSQDILPRYFQNSPSRWTKIKQPPTTICGCVLMACITWTASTT
jgi:glycosyltransferase involved in cell wall biosynthesis